MTADPRVDNVQRPDTVAIGGLTRVRVPPSGITPVTRYQTDDGKVHDTCELAELHLKKLATTAWQAGLEHYLHRLLKLGTTISDNELSRLANVLSINNVELAKILLEKPK